LDLPEGTTQITLFLKENYSSLNFDIFRDLVVLVFNHAWFCFNIYERDVYLTQGFNDGKGQELQDCRVMPATEKHVRNALIWVECYLMNLA
jgi:hypothetical protein